jgi:hypothetical protein
VGAFFSGGGACSRLFGPRPGGANVHDVNRTGLSPLAAAVAANTAAAANAAARVAFDEVGLYGLNPAGPIAA